VASLVLPLPGLRKVRGSFGETLLEELWIESPLLRDPAAEMSSESGGEGELSLDGGATAGFVALVS
jgi:hypothetical protein